MFRYLDTSHVLANLRKQMTMLDGIHDDCGDRDLASFRQPLPVDVKCGRHKIRRNRVADSAWEKTNVIALQARVMELEMRVMEMEISNECLTRTCSEKERECAELRTLLEEAKKMNNFHRTSQTIVDAVVEPMEPTDDNYDDLFTTEDEDNPMENINRTLNNDFAEIFNRVDDYHFQTEDEDEDGDDDNDNDNDKDLERLLKRVETPLVFCRTANRVLEHAFARMTRLWEQQLEASLPTELDLVLAPPPVVDTKEVNAEPIPSGNEEDWEHVCQGYKEVCAGAAHPVPFSRY
jgi:hypothetical protein